jgi:sugar/nucleoside kinase (ribokinase family)
MRPGRSGGVLCAGSVVVDVAKVIDTYPAPELLATIEQVTRSTGGPGLNLAVDLRLLGARFPVGILGAVGDDQNGAFVRAECVRLGIDVAGLATLPGLATSFTDAMIERDGGRRTFFHHPGANGLLDFAGVEPSGFAARILHVGAPGLHTLLDTPTNNDAGRNPGNGWSALLAGAQAAGLHTNLELVSLAPERIRAVALPCLPHLDSIVVNELEAAAVLDGAAPPAGADGPVDWAALESLAGALVHAGVARLAVVHFPAGCVAAAPGGRTWRQGSVRVPRKTIRNTTGAGDAFAAGVVLGTHEDWPVEARLRLGVAAAAACVRSPQTSEGIGPAEACLADADRAGYRATTD